MLRSAPICLHAVFGNHSFRSYFPPFSSTKSEEEKNREKLFDNITVTWRKHKTNDGCFVFLLSGISYLVPRIWHLVSRIRSRDVCHTLCTRSLTFENPGAVLSKNLVVVHGILKRALVKEASVCTVNPYYLHSPSHCKKHPTPIPSSLMQFCCKGATYRT